VGSLGVAGLRSEDGSSDRVRRQAGGGAVTNEEQRYRDEIPAARINLENPRRGEVVGG